MDDEDSLKMDNKDEFECQWVNINYISYCNDISYMSLSMAKALSSCNLKTI